MSTFKKFTPQDYSIVPFNAFKQYNFTSASAASNSVRVFNTRFTLDEDIEYKKLKNGKLSNFSIKDKNFVVEIKSNKINSTDYFKDILPLPRSRFSKYCRGIELID